MDNFRIYDEALSASEISGLFRGGDIGRAWGPKPFNGEVDVDLDPNLTWLNGEYAEFT